MKAKQKVLTSIGIFFAIAIIAAIILPPLMMKTNCGGNGWALSVCQQFAVAADIVAQDNHSRFEVGKIGKEMRQDFLYLAGDHWGMNGADFLVKTNFILGRSSSLGSQVVIVSKRKYGNVPQPTIWNFYHQNPAHAVGYSDGTAGLISPEEFSHLDLNGFVSIANLATNSEFKNSKP